MSKTLRRPMFKMGGTTDSGIVSGFEREKFNQGTKSPEEQLAELSASVKQGTADAFATPPAYSQPGFGLSEYLALAKLGANIASAPNRGSGFKGFAASTAPAFGQFAEDLDVLNRQKMQTRAAFDAAGREAKLKAEGTAASLTAEGIVQKMSEAADLEKIKAQGEQDRLTNEAKLIEVDKVFNKLEEVEAAYADNSAKITALDPLSTTFQDDLKALQINEKSLIMQIFYLLDQDMPEDAVIEGLPLTAIKEEARKATLAALGLAEVPAEGDDKYTEYGLKYSETFTRMMDQAREAGTPKTGFETTVPTVPGMAKGGRVGLANGGDPDFPDAGPSGPPFEPGSGPNPDPGSPPIMQAQGQSPRGSSILSFAELRARLPREVSDEVVRLLATSESALLDFAQIQTQDDIARFNKNYSADLQLPAQTQVV
jgi:hypothetical protein